MFMSVYMRVQDTYEATSEDKFCGEGHDNTDDHVVEFTLSKNEDETSGA